MNEQIVVMVLVFIGLVISIVLPVWNSKKRKEYKNDERWQLIQNKANKAANFTHLILVVLLLVGCILSFFDIEITFSLNNLITYGIIYILVRNIIELFTLMYFDKRI